MTIISVDRKKFIPTKEAKQILGNCSNTTLFNLINHHKAFSTKKIGNAIFVDLESFKKYCKEERGIEVPA